MSLIIYGVHPVEMALEHLPRSLTKLYLREGQRNQHARIAELASSYGVEIITISSDELDSKTGDGTHQGVVAELEGFPYRGLSDILDWTKDRDHALLVMLDGVEDPQNLGAVIRSAAAMGAVAVIVAKNRACGVTSQVVKASAGMAFAVPIVRVTNIARTIEDLAEEGFWSVAGVMDGELIWRHKLPRKVVMVIGGEGSGVRRLVRESCDLHARIDMAAGVESLNVSVAASIMMYEWKRQLELDGK